tara:strand:+ start:426 stop:1427 length:1002 start_codon:yes stop_codon:yes gene_type:complete
MIIKQFNLKKDLNKEINFYLLYGKNIGQIEDTINNILKPNFSKDIFYYDEQEVLNNTDIFKENIFNNSFFENDKLIIISRATDKLLPIIQELIEKEIKDLKIIIKSGILEKKSKLRNYFEKNSNSAIIPFYEDSPQSLMIIANDFFRQKGIKITQENINYIVGKSMGSRIFLKNELDKIENYSLKKKTIRLEDIIKLTNSAENYDISELTDHCLAKNKKKTIKILNENITSVEENILILKSFLYKLKRLKKIKEELIINKNQEQVLTDFKPAIFWKDKEIIKQQLKSLSLMEIKLLMEKINYLELLIKKNSQISTQIVNNFILEKLNSTSNVA